MTDHPDDTAHQSSPAKPASVKPAKKERLDVLVHARGLAPSREKAQAMIIAGMVLSGDQRLTKPGVKIASDAELRVKGKMHPYVSRGGLKLAAAFDHYDGLMATGFTAIDVGASTGGFTDVMLRHGAAKVFAVDVGHGQLDWALRSDDRVVVMEKTNARYLTAEDIPDVIDMVVCDASFISLKKVLPASMALAREGAVLAALIKPQFEVGRADVGKGGVVRDPALHQAVQDDIAAWLAEDMGWQVRGIVPSPITGPEGNKEFIIVADKPVITP
ncbi:MAG: TlyA family RNA methyltransferase [Alphaproteobacteria bacterium]|nr:TlyA family RNA methyltransferase [Alphaproteobacteria bacterium]